MIQLKTPAEIDQMAAAGRILARCHEILRSKARPGVTTKELDEAAERFIRSQGAEPAFKGYRGFPGSICASPNSMVVHGIPGAYELKRGDLLSIDIGVVLDGWVADAAITHPIGGVTPVASRLLATTRGALFDAVEQCRVGNRLGDVSHAVQTRVEADGFAVIRSLVGHGIGRDDARGPADPELRRARYGPGAGGGDGRWRSSRWSTSAPTTCGWGRTTGRSTPRTAAWPPTSSTPWRSPPTARAS